MTPCANAWCVALASPDGVYCAVHRKHPKLRLDDGPFVIVVDCQFCHGSGECQSCDGSGEHECDRDGCYRSHECGACDGTGDCECGSPRPKHGEPAVLTKADRAYLQWAFEPPLTPTPFICGGVDFNSEW